MRDRESEKERLIPLFNYVRKEVADSRLKDSKLRVIGLSQGGKVKEGDKLPGRVTVDYLGSTKIVILNAAKTREMSDVGVLGLIAHEFAHFLIKKSEEFVSAGKRDPYHVLEKSEEEADRLATEWGFGEEVKIARAEIEGFEDSELTLDEYRSIVQNRCLPKNFGETSDEERRFEE